MVTVRDAFNRGYNLLGVGVIVIGGLSFFSDLPAEIDQLPHIVDEVLLAVLSIIAILWYFIGRNRYSHTIVPIVFAVAALAIKVLGFILESSDPADRGDEYGALVLFGIAVIVLIWQYIASNRLATQAEIDVQSPETVRVR
jgi:hypothetical protein